MILLRNPNFINMTLLLSMAMVNGARLSMIRKRRSRIKKRVKLHFAEVGIKYGLNIRTNTLPDLQAEAG